MRRLLFPILMILLASCARSAIRSPLEAMRPTRGLPELKDDLEFAGLIAGLEANVKFIAERLPPGHVFNFGPRAVPKAAYLAALNTLLEAGRADASGARFRAALAAGFDTYEVYGDEEWGQIFMTSYYEPIIDGARAPAGRFTQPLYGVPKDLVEIDIGSFAAARPALSVLSEGKLEQRSSLNLLRGRWRAGEDGALPRITAYPNRAQIDGGAIKDDTKVLAWVDPIDAFFLEIQGSGVVRLPEGRELSIGYATQNGYPYVPIGKFMLDKIPKEKMTAHSIEAYLRSLPAAQARIIMQKNPSYVFFRPVDKAGLSFLGTEVVNGRTIATDPTYFPKGVLAFLEFNKPIFAKDGDTEPTEWRATSRFVLDQDTGGAIRGPSRVDLFWGRGPAAKQSAGVIKNKGRLVYFVPRAEK